jgi:hypothetical protein
MLHFYLIIVPPGHALSRIERCGRQEVQLGTTVCASFTNYNNNIWADLTDETEVEPFGALSLLLFFKFKTKSTLCIA